MSLSTIMLLIGVLLLAAALILIKLTANAINNAYYRGREDGWREHYQMTERMNQRIKAHTEEEINRIKTEKFARPKTVEQE